jgi:hypothetical protein
MAENMWLEIPELLVASPGSGNRRARRIKEGDTDVSGRLDDGRWRKSGAARVRVGLGTAAAA